MISTKGLLTYRDFCLNQPENVTAEDAQKNYDNYKESYHKKNARRFFEEHQNAQWMRELYHPGHPYYKIMRNKTKLLEDNYTLFKSRHLSGQPPQFPMIEIDDKIDSIKDKDTGAGEKPKKEKKKRDAFVDNCIKIMNIPQNCSRDELISKFKEINGFQKLFLSKPNPTKEYIRVGYLFYDTQEHCKEAKDRFAQTQIPLTIIASNKKNAEIANSFDSFVPRLKENRKRLSKFVDSSYLEDFDRVSKDVKQTLELAKALDAEKGFKDTFLMDQTPGNDAAESSQDHLQPLRQYQMILCYLRNVHLYSYYRHQQYSTEEELFNEDIIVELKEGSSPSWRIAVDNAVREKKIKMTKLAKTKATDSEKKPSIEEHDGKEEVHPIMSKYMRTFYSEKIVKKSQNKFKCALCPKLFRSGAFVQKHIALKHLVELNNITNEAEHAIYLKNYMADPRRPREAPVVRIPKSEHDYNRGWNNSRTRQPQQMRNNRRENPRQRPRMDSERESDVQDDGRNNFNNGFGVRPEMGRMPQRRMISYADVDAPELPEEELNLDYGFGPLREKPKDNGRR